MISNFTYSNITVADTEFYRKYDSYVNLKYNSFNVDFNKTGTIPDCLSKSFFIKNLLQKSNDDFSGILPPAIKYNVPGLIVFERPPCYQVVQYIPRVVNDIRDDSTISTYRIPIPWQLYIISYDQKTYLTNYVRMYFMNSSLSSTDQILHMPTLPNFFTNGLLCRPMYESMNDINCYSKDLFGVISSAYDWIWNSGFNHDLTENLVYAVRFKSFQEYLDKDSLTVDTIYNIRTSPSVLESLFSVWEKIPFEDILHISWPNPSLTYSFEEDIEYYMEHDYDRFEADNSDDFPYLWKESQTFDQVIRALFDAGQDCPENLFLNMDNVFSHAFKAISMDNVFSHAFKAISEQQLSS